MSSTSTRGPKLAPRKVRRGDPDDTRRRLVTAAARELERHGYHGTDSNRIARAAGYAPGTFYKHFVDKREVLLAAHEDWVSAEWDAVDQLSGPPAARAAAVIDFVIGHHKRWRGLRSSVRALVATDAKVRAFHRAQRKRQLERMDAGPDAPPERRAAAALLLLEIERIADAIADGEAEALGVEPEAARDHLIGRVLAYLAGAGAGSAVAS
jgi:AcrR family transcriptional regulator